MITLDEIRLKLISTDNMIKGVRLGIGITQSSQLQNIESVLKLISADIQDVLSSFNEYIKETKEIKNLEESIDESPKAIKKK